MGEDLTMIEDSAEVRGYEGKTLWFKTYRRSRTHDTDREFRGRISVSTHPGNPERLLVRLESSIEGGDGFALEREDIRHLRPHHGLPSADLICEYSLREG